MERNDRDLLFWCVCIPLRLHLAGIGDSRMLRLFASVVGARWVLGHEDGSVGLFGGPAWWADERPLHGLLWSTYAISGNKNYLLADVWFGAFNWLLHSTYSRPRVNGFGKGPLCGRGTVEA